ncbi:MAG: amidophosphoribosyltransferase [Gammaproteobacteria bacterium]|nr:amidophosphoribosyltransferase [Gammaproteobacteria bacterium]
MCGVVAAIGPSAPVNDTIYEVLGLLQHRGQDAAGIVTSNHRNLFARRALGLVKDVFRMEHMLRLKGHMGVGHVRYPTAGNSGSAAEAQPFYVNSPYGLALAHNGNLTNAEELAAKLYETDLRHINTSSDSEVLLNILAHEMQQVCNSTRLEPDQLFTAIEGLFRQIRGGFAVVGVVVGRGIFAFRDTHGIRPLLIGERDTLDGAGKEYLVASESMALVAAGYTVMRDIRPGEAVYIEPNAAPIFKQVAAPAQFTPCIFEYVYFARPDSEIDGLSVYRTRINMGTRLAEKILNERPNHDIDVVIPIPESSRPSALECAFKLGVPYREGFVKNRYVGRTFIMPGQAMRKKSVRQKLNAIADEFAGKNVLLVDDSIVRGTTSEQIVAMAREAGAAKVYFASAAPPVRYPNVYGIDMPSVTEFIAHGRNDAEICEQIGADWLIYQNLEDLKEAVRSSGNGPEEFDCACFDGNYVTGDVTEAYLEKIGRGDAVCGDNPTDTLEHDVQVDAE